MTIAHRAAAILPCSDLERSTAFYARLGFERASDSDGVLVRIGRRAA